MSGPVICFYGDDFTGAAENLAQFHAHGLRSRLYFEPADFRRVLAEASELDVVGIAGVARSRAPAEMRPLLRDAFALFGRLGSRLNQYKICSTFDSSPDVGNFAVAVEEALRIWPSALLPVLPATPDFGRYTAFANHFSSHRGEILRLDRNPALVAHPSTPMHEADLRLHLNCLGLTTIAAVMLPELAATPETLASLIAERGEAAKPVVLDTIDNGQLRHVCAAIWLLTRQRDVFCLAAQGLPQGIGGVIATALGRSSSLSIAGVDEPGLVLSGSCARQTAVQLEVAEAAGWTLIRLPVEELASPGAAERTVATIAGQMLRALSDGCSTAIYTARGSATQDFKAERAQAVGEALSRLFREAVRHAGQHRVVFAGGDSSSFAMRATGAYAMEIAGSTGRQASHVCRLLAEGELNGAEVILKGGQAGGDRFFLNPLL
jgi:3-oxoisoapionate kinase